MHGVPPLGGRLRRRPIPPLGATPCAFLSLAIDRLPLPGDSLMKFCLQVLIVFMIVPSVTLSSAPRPEAKLNELKQEAIARVDDMRVMTQQMVDQMYS